MNLKSFKWIISRLYQFLIKNNFIKILKQVVTSQNKILQICWASKFYLLKTTGSHGSLVFFGSWKFVFEIELLLHFYNKSNLPHIDNQLIYKILKLEFKTYAISERAHWLVCFQRTKTWADEKTTRDIIFSHYFHLKKVKYI